jgi:hypothetical protein
MSTSNPLVIDIQSEEQLFSTMKMSTYAIIGAFHELSSFDPPWMKLLFETAEELADIAKELGFVFAKCWTAEKDPGSVLWDMADLTGTPSFILINNGEVKDSFHVGMYEEVDVKHRLFNWMLEAAAEASENG